jgi:hypothetical protein
MIFGYHKFSWNYFKEQTARSSITLSLTLHNHCSYLPTLFIDAMPLRFPTSLLRPRTQLAQRARTPLRNLYTTPVRCIKEDGNRSPQELEDKKEEQVDKQRRGEGHWHEDLASKGESDIKADKEDVDNHDEHMEDLQDQTAKKSEKGDL